MSNETWQHLDERLRLRLSELDPVRFEQFFLRFLNAGISLTVERHGRAITRRVIKAELYAAGSGRNQKGIDLRAEVEGDGAKEVWVFQCKRHKSWDVSQTRKAVQKAAQYQAHHYFLAVACDPHEDVQDEIHKYANWTFWNLDTICAEFQLRVRPSKHAQILFFLSAEELKRFVPFTTEALLPPETFFERFLGADKTFRHDWTLVGRRQELQTLRDLLAGPHKVQVLCAKGGDGKSRLLWELCRTLAADAPETDVLCLNPHRGADELSFAFIGDARRRLVLVDDAHRTEQVPLPLLALVQQDPAAKIILATRPQGVEALAHKLHETGLTNDSAPQLSLSRLNIPDLKGLAGEALGDALAVHAGALAGLTDYCPFLTVIAGELLRLGRLEWGKWASDEEFRWHVFREFEQRNFETIPEADRDFARGLLRLLALLAPAVIDTRFLDRAARTLGCSVFKLETQLQRLRQCELAAGGDDGLRIVPDLFADFLVYDTCYGPGKMPGFVQQVVHEFDGSSPALLRNLSEATWVARANEVSDDNALISTLLEPERRQFESASFYKRAEMLRHWSGFSVYLPAESLEFARKAIALDTAPVDETQKVLMALGDSDHAYVCAQIPALLQPVATYHEPHRHEALDLLWSLGLTQSWTQPGSKEEHPWAMIARVIHFEPKKSIEVTLDALAWLSRQVQKPNTLQALEGATPILRVLVGPCFERTVETSQWEGRTVHLSRQAVSVQNTQPIRDRALEILAWVIEHGSPPASLDALSALETAVGQVTRCDAVNIDHEARVRADWLPERRKALRLYAAAVARHSSVAIRYAIRQTLHQCLNPDEDPEFAADCRRIIRDIADDLELIVAMVILPQDPFEFDEATEPHDGIASYERAQKRWEDRVRDTASRLAESYPNTDALREFLEGLAAGLAQAGHHVQMGPLFAEIAQVAPATATRLAQKILEQKGGPPLTLAWPALVEENNQLEAVQRLEMFQLAAGGATTALSVAVIRALSSRIPRSKPITAPEQKLLLDVAARASQEETIQLLQLVERRDSATQLWAYRILRALPLRELPPPMVRTVFRALVPYGERPNQPPHDVVQSVLNQLVSTKDLGRVHSWPEWTSLVNRYPRLIYELLRDRILAATAGQAPEDYRAFPRGCLDLELSALAQESDYPTLCEDLWHQVSAPPGRENYAWVRLFQAVVFLDPTQWPPRMANAIEAAKTAEDLARITQLLKFDGSRIIFRFPDITRAVLKQALAIGGDRLFQVIRVDLHAGCGPQTRMFSEGILDQKLDYVEAEAWKAAEAHHADELLGPFYRWIVKVEQEDRVLQKMQSDATMAALD